MNTELLEHDRLKVNRGGRPVRSNDPHPAPRRSQSANERCYPRHSSCIEDGIGELSPIPRLEIADRVVGIEEIVAQSPSKAAPPRRRFGKQDLGA
jgi:hypothetical protein